MKKMFLLAASAALVACSENPTQPENLTLKAPHLTVLTPGGNNLLACFDGTHDTGGFYGGVCTTSADHKKAFLDNSTTNSNGDFADVYSFDQTVYGRRLTDVTALSYTYKSTTNPAQVPTLGDLSYNIPIDANADGVFDSSGPDDFYALVDAANCGLKSGATVNIVTMANCGIVDGSPRHTPTLFLNWAAFVAAYSDAKIGPFDDGVIFITAQRTPSEPTAKWTISNVSFGKTGLICSDGTSSGGPQGGTCTLGSDFKSATLDNNSGDGDGDASAVYSRELTAYGLFLTNIHDLTYKYKGPVPTPGGLSYNIPIDTDGNNETTEFTAFVDAYYCRGTPNGSGVYSVNITKDANCGIWAGSPGTFYANWAAFAAAQPNIARISNGDWIFLIAERDPGAPGAVWSILEAKWGAKGK